MRCIAYLLRLLPVAVTVEGTPAGLDDADCGTMQARGVTAGVTRTETDVWTVEDTLAMFGTQLLQTKALKQVAATPAAAVTKDSTAPLRGTPVAPSDALAFVHVPYNFGHTVEKVALVGPGPETFGAYLHAMGGADAILMEPNRPVGDALSVMQPGGQVWGHLHPDLQQISSVTGCPLYFTPQKHWPQEVLKSYFGNRTPFGILRDPYERLVSMFRGGFENYGFVAEAAEARDACDVNAGVLSMLKTYLNNGTYVGNCAMVPQSEFWEGPYGIKTSVDNRRFYPSMNEVWSRYNITNMNITRTDVMHVTGCDNNWAADLANETKSLVRQIYRKDFELICKEFGYCNFEENVCLSYVEGMCPPDFFEWDDAAAEYVLKASAAG